MTAELLTLLQAIGTVGRRRLLLLAFLTLLGGLAEFGALLALLRLLRSWLKEAASLHGGAALAFAVAIVAAGAVRLAILAATQKLAHGAGHQLLVAVQRRVLARPWTVHATARASGPLLAIEQVENVIYGILLPLLQGGAALVLGLFILAALLRVDAGLALAAGGLLAILFLIAVVLTRPALRRLGEQLNVAHEERIAAIQQHGGAMRELILTGLRTLAAERFAAIDRRVAQGRASISVTLAAPRLIVETVGLLALTGFAWFLAGRSGGLEGAVPSLAALALGGQRLLPLAQTLSQAATGLVANRPYLSDLAALLGEPDLDEPEPGPPLPFEREMRLDGLGFTYPGRERPALSGVDLVIRRGERVALVGANGSGKSSLADLVMGLLPPDEGSITIDGEPLGSHNLARWQRNIAHVPQAPFLADASIAFNIAFFVNEPDRDRMIGAARIAGLHETIEALPHGYETRVGERGILLSGGQRQRLALARALYAPAPLLVLDEATSALDPESEQHVLRVLNALQAAGTTIILIAHRASLLEGCSRILRLVNGRVAE